jgi:aryl-alcohol dehydrogenase-like predicted oxidoreductase
MGAVLAQPWMDTVLSGASTVGQLESNLGAFAISWDERLEEQLGALIEPPDRYWKTRSELPWN